MFLEPLLGTVAGKVTDGSGNPLSGAAVAFSGGTIPTQISVTAAANGTYTVPSISVGSYKVTATAAGHTTATATTTVTQGQTTTVNFQLTGSTSGACSAPTSPGVSICLPASGTTVSSPVLAEAAGTVTGTMSHMELWIDGVKKFSENGGLLNTSLSLASGTHRFAFLALNTAGAKWTAAVNATVSSSGLITPTITWSNPASITYGAALSGAQLNATANVPGSFAYSPAAGTVLSVGTHTLSTTFTPTDTTHYTTATKSVSITVTSGGASCNAPASPGVTVCSPANNGTVGTTVQAQAAAAVTGTFARMELWIDGVKKYSETTSKLLNTTVSVTAGSHRFAFLAVNTAGQKWQTTVTATAK
jgi:hypothetical protein